MQYVHVARHICDICATVFKSRTGLTKHVRRVHSDEPKQPKVQCTVCGNWLSDGRGLKKHMDRHEQTEQTCQLCGKVTPNLHALGAHMRYVHSERIHKCTLCEKSFKKEIGLKVGTRLSVESLCLTQRVCCFNGLFGFVLQEHMAMHTGVDLYTCTYCPQTFKSNSNMFAHRKKRHPIEWARDREIRIMS